MFQPPFIRPDLTSARASEKISTTFLGKIVRIEISDQRWFEGYFICVDSGMNVILQGSHQFRREENVRQTVQKQWVGMIMIPGKHIVDVAVKEERVDAQQAAPQPFLPPPIRHWSAFPQDDSAYN